MWQTKKSGPWYSQYYNVNDNWPMLEKYRRLVSRLCFRWLRRRSQKGKTLSWSDYYQLLSATNCFPLTLWQRQDGSRIKSRWLADCGRVGHFDR
ncbi:MAG TPA: hypothetical protein PLR25_23175 [Planctomycetaceae bacterium]|nr:hypothetical protein [Planctomycetaceae bacterium]